MVKRVRFALAALVLCGGYASGQNLPTPKLRLIPSASAPAGSSSDIFFWSNGSASNHPALRLAGIDYDLLYTLGGLSVSTTVPTANQLLFWNNGSSSWAPRLLTFADLSTPSLVGSGASQVPAGNDSRFPPSPSTLGNLVVDNGAGAYISQSKFTADVRDYSSLSTAISAQGGFPTTITIPNTVNITSSLSVPSNIHLAFTGAGKLNISSGQTVTVSGALTAPLTQIVTGTGALFFAAGSPSLRVYPQWWGAVGDGSTICTSAIQAAADSLRDVGGSVFFFSGTYIIKKPGVHLQGTVSHSYSNIAFVGDGATSVLKAGEAIGTNNGVPPLAMVYFDGQANFSMTNSGVYAMRLSGLDTTTLAGPLLLFSRTSGGFLINSFLDTHSTEGAYWNAPTSDYGGICTGNHANHVGGWGVSPPAGPLSPYNVNTNDAVVTGNEADHCGLAVEIAGSGPIISNNDFQFIGSGVAGLSNGVALELASSIATDQCAITGNTIKQASVAISFSVTSGTGTCSITSNAIENVDQALSATNSAPILFADNIIKDTSTAGTGSSAVIDHAAASTAPIIARNNIIVAGSTGTWAYAVYVRDAVITDIYENNTAVGDGFNAAVFHTSPASTGWNTQFINNTVIPLTMANGTSRYDWHNQGYTKTVYAGIDNGITISELRPTILRGASIPIAGTYVVGAIEDNTSKTATGVDHWLCTVAGTPGTWVAQYASVQNGTGLGLSGNTLSTNFGTTSGTSTQGNDTRLPPTPSGAGKVIYDNGSAYVAAAAGTGSQYLKGGATPAFGGIAAADVPVMVGASAGVSGASGAAPQPVAGQQGNFLRGDGTWATVTGTGTVTNVATDATLTGGPITTTGTLGIALGNANTWTAAQTWPAGSGSANGSNPVTLFSTVAVVNSVTTGTIDGNSYTMPANTLSANGQSLVWTSGGIHGATVNSASIATNFNAGGQTNTASTVSGESIQITIRVVRISSSTARLTGWTQKSSAGATSYFSTLASGINFANTIVLKTTITGATANGDMNTEFMRVEWWP